MTLPAFSFSDVLRSSEHWAASEGTSGIHMWGHRALACIEMGTVLSALVSLIGVVAIGIFDVLRNLPIVNAYWAVSEATSVISMWGHEAVACIIAVNILSTVALIIGIIAIRVFDHFVDTSLEDVV